MTLAKEILAFELILLRSSNIYLDYQFTLVQQNLCCCYFYIISNKLLKASDTQTDRYRHKTHAALVIWIHTL